MRALCFFFGFFFGFFPFHVAFSGPARAYAPAESWQIEFLLILVLYFVFFPCIFASAKGGEGLRSAVWLLSQCSTAVRWLGNCDRLGVPAVVVAVVLF